MIDHSCYADRISHTAPDNETLLQGATDVAAASAGSSAAGPDPVSVAGTDDAAADPLGGADSGSLADLGICLGDILPAVKEKYPNKKIFIQIHTIRAPSIILSRMKGG